MWLRILGLLALLQPIGQGLLWLLRIAGDVDFLVERAKDPGWIGWVATAFVAPPPWLPSVLVVIGLLLIWLDARRRSRSAITPQSTSSTPVLPDAETLKQFRLLEKQRDPTRRGTTRDKYLPLKSFLDEATKYGIPLVREKPKSHLRQLDSPFLNKLRQAAADGDVHIQGRNALRGSHQNVILGALLIPIEPTFWRDHFIDDTVALTAENNWEIHTRTGSYFAREREMHFFDIHVDADEAREWLKRLDRSSTVQKEHRANPTFIRFRTDNMYLIDSYNVSSLGDDGDGAFTITFSEDLDHGTLAVLPLDSTPNTFRVLAARPGSVRVLFTEKPEVVSLRFDDGH